jgi:hypothetical protein
MKSRKRFVSSLRRRNGVSEVVAVLLLVVIVIGVATIVYLFGLGVIQSLIAGGVNTPITATGQMTVPGSTDQLGVLTMTIRNTESLSITNVVVTCPSSFVNPANCVKMTYLNNPIPPAVGPPGQTVVGSAPVSAQPGTPFVAGTVYSILLRVTFASGSVETLDVSVTAIS